MSYSLVDAARKSSPDSDPNELKRRIREAEEKRLETLESDHKEHKEAVQAAITDLKVEVARLGASFRAWLGAAALFITIVQVLIRVVWK